MKRTLASLVAVSFFSSISMAAVTGSIGFSGTAPKAEAIKMGDPNCMKGHEGQKVMKEDIVVNANKTLANVFVYVKEGVKKESVPPVPTTPVKFDQSGCHYNPHVVGVRVGQAFQIHNSDQTMHNVHSTAKANSAFNMGMTTGQMVEKKFTKPETMVKVK
jgi:plastocyanin